MVSIKEKITAGCCGKFQISLEIDKSVSRDILKLFEDSKFLISNKFKEAGIIFIEDENIVATCPFGQNRFQIKIKNKEKWSESVDYLKKLLLSLE